MASQGQAADFILTNPTGSVTNGSNCPDPELRLAVVNDRITSDVDRDLKKLGSHQ
jgi:hypothetical protein